MVLDKGVGRFGGSSECGPKRCVRYHYSASCGVIMLSYDVFFNLTIVGKKTIIEMGNHFILAKANGGIRYGKNQTYIERHNNSCANSNYDFSNEYKC